ncbi:MAG TPA: BON domain-containing protein [Terriglobales bacterium]|nr:BON domain-containing protein [Terriglobales bacterium]
MGYRMQLYFTLILLVALSTGCSKRPNDEQIKTDIQTKVAADPDTKDSDLTVTSNQGKVELQGRVPSSTARTKLQQIAKAEPGVSDLDDETSVDPSLGAAAPSASPAEQAKQVEPPPPLIVPAGTHLVVRTGEALSSKTSQSGQTFLATLAQPVSVNGKAALPAGSTVSGTVVTATAKGKIKGEGELDLQLTSISVGSHTYQIQTAVLGNTEKGKGKRTAATTGGGAAGGALIGGLAGGGKGAGIGALLGAGAGLVGGAMTGNKQIEIPAESALSFTLTQPLTIKSGS